MLHGGVGMTVETYGLKPEILEVMYVNRDADIAGLRNIDGEVYDVSLKAIETMVTLHYVRVRK